MGSQQKKKKRTEDSRSLTSEIKRTQDLDVNKLALEPTFELGYGPVGVGTISFVNVSTSIAPGQGGSAPPPQVTGLTVTPQAGSNTQLNLAWTVYVGTDFNYYNVYRGPAGFAIDPSFKITQPVTNSYNNTGLNQGTTYYYRVSTTNDADQEGIASSQVSGTTTGIGPDLWFRWDGNNTDASGNNYILGGSNRNGFISPGKFGSNALLMNTPIPAVPGPSDYFTVQPGDNLPVPLRMNTTIGFSLSVWVYPTDISDLGLHRNIASSENDANNQWTLEFDSAGIIYFNVKKAGASIRQQVTGLVTNSWQHIAAVYDAVANTVRVYRNAVTGTGTTEPTQYSTYHPGPNFMIGLRLDGFTTNYAGRIDELQFFNGKVLTPTQVTNLMNTNAP